MGWDRRVNRYDLHPVVRGVTWHGMGRIGQRIIYRSLEAHFEALPAHPREARSLDDLTAVIEFYNTLASLERYDEAYAVFEAYLVEPMCYRLSLCAQAAECLEMLFQDGLDTPPLLEHADQQLRATWNLAYSYGNSGQAALTARLWQRILDELKSSSHVGLYPSRAWANLSDNLTDTGHDPRCWHQGSQPRLHRGKGDQAMKTVEMAEAIGPLAEYAEQACKETVVVTRRGRPVAAVVPIGEADLETLSLATNPDFLGIIERSRVRCPAGDGISTEEMRRHLATRRMAG